MVTYPTDKTNPLHRDKCTCATPDKSPHRIEGIDHARQPRLVFVLAEFPMLSETFVLNQIALFVEQGFNVRIVSMNRSYSGLDHPWLTRYALMDKVQYIFKRNKLRHKIFTLLDSIVTDIAQGRGATLKQLWTLGAKSYLLSRVLPEEEALVVCHFGHIGAEVAKIKALRSTPKLKLVTFFHGADVSIRSHLKQHSKAYQTLFAQGVLMLPVSQFWANRLADMGCPADKIQVQHMGIEVDSFSFSPRYQHRSLTRPIQLITVCRFVEKKGLPVLIDCMSLLGPQYRLTVIGDGPLLNSIEQQILSLGLERCINLCGPLVSDEVATRLDSADAFILPSVTASNGDMEGIPVSLMEAMAKGLLVFSTLHSGIPELIEDGVNGYMVDENDAHQLAQRIRQTFEHQTAEQRQPIADAARRTVETHFNLKLLNDSLMSKISQLPGP